jgi:hypothetical protein
MGAFGSARSVKGTYFCKIIRRNKRPRPNYKDLSLLISYRYNGQFEGSEETLALNLGRRCKLAEGNVETVVVESVTEIVDIVSLDCIDSIIDSSLKGSFSCAREICFQGRGACV